MNITRCWLCCRALGRLSRDISIANTLQALEIGVTFQYSFVTRVTRNRFHWITH